MSSTMPYVRLGGSGLKVSKLIFNGASEIVLGKAIKQHQLPRDEIVIMTKVFFAMDIDKDGKPTNGLSAEEKKAQRLANQRGLSRKHIFESIKHSLERLQLDYVDVLQCHRFDPDTAVAETMHALNDVVKAGYARYIGMSSCYAWQFHKMQAYARENGLAEFISMQNFHNALYREEEREMAPLLQDLGVGMIPWSPLGMGFLARPLNSEGTVRKAMMSGHAEVFMGETGKAIVNSVEAIAKAHNVSMAQVALAWSLSKPFVTAPIVGTTSIDKLKDLVAGLDLKLTDEELKSIDDGYQPRPIFGH
ncbi:hypothetical protein FRB97_003235 [Tulasnella sp. 331]|nr:hypothetical protein FRB97_003235 [Tulasnella sp. 331]